jgi:putative ABC transport system substrate-binding protein
MGRQTEALVDRREFIRHVSRWSPRRAARRRGAAGGEGLQDRIGNARKVADLTAKNRLPAIGFREYFDAGGLMAYAVNFPTIWRRAGFFVDKILKGTKPAELPVEQASKFDLVINLKTAKALGLTIPPSLLQRADQVIE